MSLQDEFFDNADPDKALEAYHVQIETPRLILREHTAADADGIHAMTNKPGFFYYCFDGTREKVDAFLAEADRTKKPNPETGLRDNHMLAITLKDTGEMIGHVCLQRVEYVDGLNFEVNFFVDPAYQSKGYGQEAIINMMHYGFQELGLYAYTVTIHPNNGPSQKVAKISGYQKIADISIDTVRGREPRDLFILTKQMFYEMRKNDKRPLLLDWPPADASQALPPAPNAGPQPGNPAP